ncbi:cytosine permease [Salmonella enterica]|uniref:Cytosine permease n=2 Tax=Salmonella enterica TaxID=28901 RepID=A0A744GFT7_SALER|nr:MULTISPECIES: cytosine permease [Citrobacter]EAN1156243.1 cytosine permease [Salmonella enterica]EBS3611236.1 cytosine permease [Salmonella enterica subsp. enterica serovar Poona]EBS4088735.1 cytosine permease [Salmonella enterica subsp. enterica serovar Newport]EBV1275516.1 cytosine permease [Salmonella enterica subsp. enterica serovar Oranienburg]EBW8396513.1 cytosine permease [Salmonella enterica subsp. enterica serovar Florida]EBW9463488.1 cytosine permease [Salmonella enterica subsp. 
MRKTEESMNTASGLRIAMILLGIAVTPVLLSSSSLGNQLSSSSLVTVVLLGGLILTILAAITISVGEKARLPTYGIVKYAFGEKGAIAINILMAISLFGWIAVTANMFGHSVHDLLLQHGITLPVPLLVIAGCVVFVASTAFGFAVLGKVAQVAVPIIALVLCYILYIATHSEVTAPAEVVSMNTGVAVSTVVGTIIVLVATLPDFGSFVHNRKHALISAAVTFLIAYPLLYWAGATPSALSGQGSLLGAMTIFGAVLPGALLLIFACVTGNAGNMFQGTLVVSTLLTRFPKWQITIALGVLSAIVGSLDIMAWFIPFLLFLGIATPPVAGIYIADFFLYRRNGYQELVLTQEPQIKVLTFVAWILGAAVGFMTVKGLFTLTSIPSVDSIVVACIAYILLSRLGQHH